MRYLLRLLPYVLLVLVMLPLSIVVSVECGTSVYESADSRIAGSNARLFSIFGVVLTLVACLATTLGIGWMIYRWQHRHEY